LLERWVWIVAKGVVFGGVLVDFEFGFDNFL
jgi:hypothetical protein